MPTVAVLEGVQVRFYPGRDHPPPHVHAVFGERVAVVGIAGGEVLQGSLPANKLALVRAYVEANKVDLLRQWEAAEQKRGLR